MSPKHLVIDFRILNSFKKLITNDISDARQRLFARGILIRDPNEIEVVSGKSSVRAI